MEKFKNRYRIESIRLKDWDYSSDAYYFVTICTKDRICHLGEIINDEMMLSEQGKIVQNQWLN